MEVDEPVQDSTFSEPVSNPMYDPNHGYADLSWETPVPPPRDHTQHATTSFVKNDFGQQLWNIQQQLAGVIDGQATLHAEVAGIHATMKGMVIDTAVGSPRDGPRIADIPVERHWGSQAESGNSQWPSLKSGSPPSNQRPSGRSHTVMPFQRKLMKTRSNMCIGSLMDGVSPQISADDGSRRVQGFTQMPSRNHFASRRFSQSDDMVMLFELFRIAETERSKNMDATSHAYIRKQSTNLGLHSAGIMIDSVFGSVIVMNAIFIGILMDQSDTKHFLWTAVDIGFTGVFLIEIGIRIWAQGLCKHFCGSSRIQNIFDAGLVFIDLMQQFIDLAFPSESEGLDVGPSASLLRIGKLGKLARMLHLLRLSIFTDVLTILQSMLGGLTTLGWSTVLFTVAIYIAALFFREFFGNGNVPNVTEMFSSVPRSMFTTFRCSFGDCSTSKGVPIFEYVNVEYGGFASLLYCSFLFVITVGLFNVISATFVESTMQAASTLQTKRRKERMRDHILWCNNVNVLIHRLLVISEVEYDREIPLTERLQEVYFLEVPCSAIDELAQDPVAVAALSALDIPPEDRDYLSDILDPDNGGTINVIEIVEGLRMLRGAPRRSDMVTINLMIRSVQRDIGEMFDIVREIRARQSLRKSHGGSDEEKP